MKNKTVKKPLDLRELINKKEEILANKENKSALIFIKSLNAHVKAVKPSSGLVGDVQEMESGADEYLIYECVVEPNLKDEELQREFNCAEPIEIVAKLFESGEIAGLAREILKLSGYFDGVKTIKN